MSNYIDAYLQKLCFGYLTDKVLEGQRESRKGPVIIIRLTIYLINSYWLIRIVLANYLLTVFSIEYYLRTNVIKLLDNTIKTTAMVLTILLFCRYLNDY